MGKKEYKITINAPKEKVWSTLGMTLPTVHGLLLSQRAHCENRLEKR